MHKDSRRCILLCVCCKHYQASLLSVVRYPLWYPIDYPIASKPFSRQHDLPPKPVNRQPSPFASACGLPPHPPTQGQGMPNIHNILTIIGHRFGHQSGLDESSGGKFTTFLHGIGFRVYLVFSKIDTNTAYLLIFTVVDNNLHLCNTQVSFSKKQNWGRLGVQIYVQHANHL